MEQNQKTSERKNWAVRIAVIVLALTLITACLLGSTFAKFTTTTAGTSTATVATWDWEINDATATGSSFTFDLFATVKEEDGTTAESDVASGKIAPGTGGSFAVVIANLSDVNGTYSIAFTETNASNLPIEYSTDGGTTWSSTVSDIDVTDEAIAMTSGTDTVTVQWRWAFYVSDTQDGTDTTAGIAGTATVAVTATATFTQVD